MIDLLLAACGAFVLVQVIEWHKIIGINRKPLNCHVCMAAWLWLPLHFIEAEWFDVPFMMCAAMCLVIALNWVMKKML